MSDILVEVMDDGGAVVEVVASSDALEVVEVIETGPQGPPGPMGPAGDGSGGGTAGADGASAYEVAVANGFVGSEAQWLASLEGPAGTQGPAGPEGPAGPQGEPGAAGATGPEGPQGPTGPEGPQGPEGAAGMALTPGTAAGDLLVWDGDSYEPVAPIPVTATDVPFTPSGALVATNVQDAVTEAAAAAAPLANAVVVVDAGTNLSAARATGAAATFWRFSAGVDVGTDGANVTNGLPGDLYFVASA